MQHRHHNDIIYSDGYRAPAWVEHACKHEAFLLIAVKGQIQWLVLLSLLLLLLLLTTSWPFNSRQCF